MYYLAVDLITAAVQAEPELGSALLQHIAAGDSATAKKVAEQIWKLHTDPDLVITILRDRVSKALRLTWATDRCHRGNSMQNGASTTLKHTGCLTLTSRPYLLLSMILITRAWAVIARKMGGAKWNRATRVGGITIGIRTVVNSMRQT